MSSFFTWNGEDELQLAKPEPVDPSAMVIAYLEALGLKTTIGQRVRLNELIAEIESNG